MRTALNILSFLSLTALTLLVALWIAGLRLGPRHSIPVRLGRPDGVRWQLWSRDGRLVLDDAPQKLFEDAEEARLDQAVAARSAEEASAMEWWRRVEWPAAGLPDARRAEAVAEYRRAEVATERAADAYHAAVIAHAQMKGNRRATRVTSYSAPIALPVAVAAALPGALGVHAVISRRRRVRRIAGALCRRCGYDRRASGERCPECGEVAGLGGG